MGAFTFSATFPIAAADNPAAPGSGQTFNLVCRVFAGSINMAEIQITATFFPTSHRATGFVSLLSESEQPEVGE